MLLRPGDTIGGFRVDDVIGIGGMAIVYRAEQVSLGRPVALKVLSTKLTSDTTFRERFRREGTHAAALEHPNIVPVYDSGEQDGHLYLAMRLVEGTNLAELIHTRGLTADQTIEILRPIASALDTAHAAGLIHRDVKPQNILITAQGHPYLADFGVAKGSNTAGLTATGGFVGSINYASPEQIKGLTLTPASDVYALTAVLYQCLTGDVPFPRETDAGIMHAHLNEPPPTLPTVAGANSDFHTVLARGMAKDAGARYSHAGDLINAAALSVGRLPSKTRTSVPAFPRRAVSDATADIEPPSSSSTDGPMPSDRDEQSASAITARTPAVSQDHTELVSAEELAGARKTANLTVADQRRPPAAPPVPEVAVAKRHWRLVGGGISAVIVVALAAVLLTGGSGSAHAAAFRSENLLLSTNQEWHRDSSSLSGLELAAPIDIAASGVRVFAGAVKDPGSLAASVPASLLSADGSPSATSVIALPLGLVKRYSWTSAHVAPLALVMIATDAGEMAIACRAPAADALARALDACDAIAERARIRNTHVDYPGPDPAVAKQLARALQPRLSISTSTLRGLQAARLSVRANALTEVADVDRGAAAALTRIASAPRYRGRLANVATAVTQEGDLAQRIALAAGGGKRALYESLRSGFAAINARFATATAGIAALGFARPSIAALKLSRLPAQPHRHVAKSRPQSPSSASTDTAAPVVPAGTSETTHVVPAPYTPPVAHTPAPARHRSEPQIIITKPE
jgi:serine/threonine protein kinase